MTIGFAPRHATHNAFVFLPASLDVPGLGKFTLPRGRNKIGIYRVHISLSLVCREFVPPKHWLKSVSSKVPDTKMIYLHIEDFLLYKVQTASHILAPRCSRDPWNLVLSLYTPEDTHRSLELRSYPGSR